MANKKSTSKSTKQKPYLRILILLGIVGVICGLIAAFFLSTLQNYAQDAAKPLEKTLIANGAVKVCSGGDSGKGPDNLKPSYTAEFQLNVGKQEATQLVEKMANTNGYKLSLQKSDAHADSYTDTSSKKSTYPGFSRGNIELSVVVISDSEKPRTCTSDGKTYTTLTTDSTHTVVGLGVSLPYAGN